MRRVLGPRQDDMQQLYGTKRLRARSAHAPGVHTLNVPTLPVQVVLAGALCLVRRRGDCHIWKCVTELKFREHLIPVCAQRMLSHHFRKMGMKARMMIEDEHRWKICGWALFRDGTQAQEPRYPGQVQVFLVPAYPGRLGPAFGLISILQIAFGCNKRRGFMNTRVDFVFESNVQPTF
ncbi:unnamed protein product [Ostreobium quekettii]|uniref:Uncharacterized protein n=1 Tax=Ostreobium quekettii TaxID=121088 RepID=A0A8S1INP6_9CHLO|nr:unnamed protein product [Ostreobium quekettii]